MLGTRLLLKYTPTPRYDALNIIQKEEVDMWTEHEEFNCAYGNVQ